eukprot:gnl/MRDRNA2_/MRDRNA2_82031_c0_seq1.p1 gnl/MRDRNA2_/MRDRNA2_82031_c0~~gnl/MRDRNA2_/MRDRNA2_82031_c0_seq1.p1  ORF type:complete len:332 (-),score=80.22 gnl/MRDRNA2_/MRDRNA2_82031_c0_seq1:130-1125(-)
MANGYNHCGTRITHDPYAPGMAEKYGMPGKTDNEGFDPYRDTVGPGIYGGIVKRDENGNVVIGKQYQNHNPRPGPVYAGGGYTPTSNALRGGKKALKPLLDKYPDLVNEVTTGGATPLHMCGMGRDNQKSTAYIIMRGGDVEALDTYGMTPMHRMASNNLAIGAAALLEAGADPENPGKCGATPMQIAQQSEARDVIKVLKEQKPIPKPEGQLQVAGSGVDAVNQVYREKNPKYIPVGFSLTCAEMKWDSEQMWQRLSNQQSPWYEADNGSYIYWNTNDGQWWIDAPDGRGVYVVKASPASVPAQGWQLLQGAKPPAPRVQMLSNAQMRGA